eukprot:8341615-Pyramimonas_sp.AAC.1
MQVASRVVRVEASVNGRARRLRGAQRRQVRGSRVVVGPSETEAAPLDSQRGMHPLAVSNLGAEYFLEGRPLVRRELLQDAV